MGITNCKLRERTLKAGLVQNWNDIPVEILTSILTLLPSTADLARAASVSRLWNAAAAAASNNGWAPQRPPLLFAFRPRCYFFTLESHLTSEPYYKSGLTFRTLANSTCVGRCFSNLILIKRSSIVVVDVFSGEQIKSQEMAVLRYLRVTFATLTAPLHSSSLSLVLLVARIINSRNYCVLSWEPNGSGNRDGKMVVGTEIVSFALFKDQVYYVDRTSKVGVLEFEPKMSCRLLGKKFTLFGCFEALKRYLIVCDGDLLIVLVSQDLNTRLKIMVYKLDLEKWEWVKMEKLNNWCLFIDWIGGTGLSCKDPEIWGGKSNCICVPCSFGYVMYPVNHEAYTVNRTRLLSNYLLRKRSFLVWVYPSFESVEKVESGKAHLKFEKGKQGIIRKLLRDYAMKFLHSR